MRSIIRRSQSDTVDGFRFRLSDGSWLLYPLSGTEPVLRIYAEAIPRACGKAAQGGKGISWSLEMIDL